MRCKFNVVPVASANFSQALYMAAKLDKKERDLVSDLIETHIFADTDLMELAYEIWDAATKAAEEKFTAGHNAPGVASTIEQIAPCSHIFVMNEDGATVKCINCPCHGPVER
jgi:hypothetical protein